MGGGVRGGAHHIDAGLIVQLGLLAQDAQGGAEALPGVDHLVEEGQGVADGDDQAQALDDGIVFNAGDFGGGDAHHLAIGVDQGAAGVAGVEGGAGLEQVHVLAVHLDGAGGGGDNAFGLGAVQVAHGVADGVHRVPHRQLVRTGQLGRGQVIGLHLQNGQVQLLVIAHHLGLVAVLGGEHGHLQGHAALNDVKVGDDVAGGGGHHAGAHAGRAVALVCGDAHHRGGSFYL